MIKTYCDGCGQEIKHNYVAQRFRAKAEFRPPAMPGVVFEASITLGSAIGSAVTWNQGAICRTCLMHLLEAEIVS
jgi:hypothetical protein